MSNVITRSVTANNDGIHCRGIGNVAIRIGVMACNQYAIPTMLTPAACHRAIAPQRVVSPCVTPPPFHAGSATTGDGRHQ